MASPTRRPWSKFWDADYLADAKLNQLSFRARGIVHVLWAFSRTQTDEVGVLTVGGKSLTSAQYVDLMCRVSAVDVRTRRDYIWSWVCEALSSGCFQQREDGAWYSPRIVREAQESEKLSTYGRKGAAKTNRRFTRYNRVEAAATPAAMAAAEAAAEAAGRSEEEKKRYTTTNVGVGKDSPATPSSDRSPEPQPEKPDRQLRRHTNPPAEIDRLIDYQTEVLNKLDGITTITERADRGTLLLIARHVPPSIVHAALEATQDARLRALDGEHKRVSHARYFTDGVKRRCLSAGIQSPFTHDTRTETHTHAALSQ